MKVYVFLSETAPSSAWVQNLAKRSAKTVAKAGDSLVLILLAFLVVALVWVSVRDRSNEPVPNNIEPAVTRLQGGDY